MRVLLAGCTLLVALSAQEPPREGIFGEVRAKDAKPWVGATVTLVHYAHPAIVDPRFVDKVTATTDDRGRFRAQLLAGMRYVAWASGPVEAGIFRVSGVASEVVPGVPVLLQEGEPRWQRQVRVELDATWQAKVTLVANSYVRAFTLCEEVTLIDGLATLPPWPESPILVQVEVSGALAFTSSVPTTVAHQRARLPKTEEVSDEALRQRLGLPHPIVVGARAEFVVRLVDTKKKPIPRVRVVEEGQQPRRWCGIADDAGVVRFAHVAGRKTLYRCLVHADGFAESVIEAEDWTLSSEGEPKEKVLEAGTTVRGRLLMRDGEHSALQPVLLEGTIATGPNSAYFGSDARLFPTASDGAIALPGRTPKYPWYAFTVMTPEQRARLAGPTRAPVAPVVLLAPPNTKGPADLGDVRLDLLRPIDVRVIGVDGGVPGSVAIVLIPCPREWGLGEAPHEPLTARTDRAGRVRVLAPDGIEFAVWAMREDGAAWTFAKGGEPEHELRLDPRHVLAMQVVDQDEKPLLGTRAHVVTPEGPAMGAENAPLVARVRDAFMVHGFPFKDVPADAKGVMRVVMPLVGSGIDVLFSCGEKRMRQVIRADAFEPGKPTVIEFVPNDR